MKINKSLILGSLLLSLLATACTSTPYKRGLTPGITGIIYINSEPQANIQLYLSRDSKDLNCSKHVATAVSDNQGQFHFAAIKEQMAYTPLMTYYMNEWVICADIYGARQKIYSDNFYGQGGVTGSQNLICDSQGKFSRQLSCRNQSAR